MSDARDFHGSKLAAVGTAAGLAWRADPGRAALATVLRVISSASWVVGSWYSSRFIGALAVGDIDSARINAVVLAAVVGGATYYLGAWTLDLRFRMEFVTNGFVEQELITLSTTLPGVDHHEREEYVTEVELLHGSRNALGNASGAIFENIGALAALLSTSALLGSIHPSMWLLPLAGIPVVVAGGWQQSRLQRLQVELAADTRLRSHLATLCSSAAPGKELRVFGLATLFRGRESDLRIVAEKRTRSVLLRVGAVSVVAWAIFGAAYVGAVVFVVTGAVDGRFDLADVVLVVTLAAQVAERVSTVVQMASWLSQTLIVVDRYRWLRGEVTRLVPTERPALALPNRLDAGIHLDRVSFTYPGTDAVVLDDIDVRIPAGSTVAIVGDNGAGKTTLVKLLTLMYRPTTGRILVDDVDLADVDPEAWRARISAGFQDHCRYEFTAQRNVGIGSLDHIDDAARATRALERAASGSLVDQLDDGLATPLGRSFANGRELSGGQWQKLAIGRAMMREEPLLLVLDEPTSALDAETEHALFSQYTAAARDVAARTGGITVLVSHRFSTVRMADLIIVLDGNRVTEVGSHDDLMAAAGLYAELYELQARQYR